LVDENDLSRFRWKSENLGNHQQALFHLSKKVANVAALQTLFKPLETWKHLRMRKIFWGWMTGLAFAIIYWPSRVGGCQR
jgi:hypothetical protein